MSIKAPAMRVIIMQLKNRADADCAAYKKAHPEKDYYTARTARERAIGAALTATFLTNPQRYLSRIDHYGGAIHGTKAWNKLVTATKAKFPETDVSHTATVIFAAMNFTLAVPKPDAPKWTKLAKEIDNAFLTDDAQSIIALIAKAFA